METMDDYRVRTTGMDEKREPIGGLGRTVDMFIGVSACVRWSVRDGGMILPCRAESQISQRLSTQAILLLSCLPDMARQKHVFQNCYGVTSM